MGLNTVLYLFIMLMCGMLPSVFFSNTENPAVLTASLILTYMLSVLSDMTGIGISRMALCVCRKEPYSIADLFYAFRYSSNSFIVIQLILTAVRTVIAIPSLFIGNIFPGLDTLQYYGLILGWSAVSSVIALLITLRLRMSIFVLMDEPDMSAGDALKKALEMTKGKYLQLLVLQFSFVLEYILVILSFMIGYVLVFPYMQTANALFYESLKH